MWGCVGELALTFLSAALTGSAAWCRNAAAPCCVPRVVPSPPSLLSFLPSTLVLQSIFMSTDPINFYNHHSYAFFVSLSLSVRISCSHYIALSAFFFLFLFNCFSLVSSRTLSGFFSVTYTLIFFVLSLSLFFVTFLLIAFFFHFHSFCLSHIRFICPLTFSFPSYFLSVIITQQRAWINYSSRIVLIAKQVV